MSKIFKFLALLLPLSLAAGDQVIVRQTKSSVTMENSFIRATVNSGGGKLSSLVNRKSGEELVSDSRISGKNSGFNRFKLLDGTTVRVLGDVPFELKIAADTPERAIVEARYTASSGFAKGLQFVLRYELAAGENRLKCESRVAAVEGSGKKFSPWLAHTVKLPQDPADKKETMIYAGSSRGIFGIPGHNAPLIQATLQEPSHPWWLAAVTAKKRHGILMLGSTSRLSSLYFWIGSEYFFTAEPVFGSVRFADNVRWSETFWQIPVNGLEAVQIAAPEFAGSLEADGIRLMPAVPGKNVSVEYILDGAGSGKTNIASWKPGEAVLIKLKAPAGFRNLKLTVNIDGRKIERSARVNIDRKAVEIAARKGFNESTAAQGKVVMSHAKDTLYLTDRNIVVHFGLDSTLPKNVKKCEMILELPTTVTLRNPSASYRDKIIERDGKKIRQYRFSMRPRSYYAALTMYVKTTLAPGESTEGWFYASAPGVSQAPQKLKIVSTAIPQCKRLPKRLLSGLGFYGLTHIRKWPEIFDLMKHCGCSTISLREDSDVEAMSKIVERARKLGMYVKVNEAPAGTSKFLRRDPEGQVTAIDGSRSFVICPSYRGQAFQEEKKQLTDYALAGASIVYWDTETWNKREFCFCDRCLGLFEKWFKKNAPGMTWKSPKVFELDPAANAEYHELWKKFKIDLGAGYFGEFQKEFVRKLKAAGRGKDMTPPGVPPLFGLYGVWPGRGIYHQFMRYEEFAAAGVVNIAMPCYYEGGDAGAVGAGVRRVRKLTKNSRIIPFITGGASAEYETDAVTLRHIMLEIFLNGGMGFAVWPYLGWDAEDLKALSQTMNLVRPLEDIIVDGKVMTGLSVDNSTTNAVGLVLDKQGAILLSDYTNLNLPELTLTLTVPAAAGLYDVGSGEKLSDLKAGRNQVKLKAYGDKARVLSFGSAAPDVDYKFLPGAVVKAAPRKTVDASASGDTLKITESADTFRLANKFYTVDIQRSTGVIARIEWAGGKRVTRRNYFNTRTVMVKNDYLFGDMEKGRAQVKLERKGEHAAVVTVVTDAGTSNHKIVKPITAQIKYTFAAGSPLIKAEFNVDSQDRFNNCRLNDFSFSLENWTKVVYGPPAEVNIRDEAMRNRTFKPTSRAKGYSYVGVADDNNHALALVAAGHQPPGFVHVNNAKSLYVRGVYRRLNVETVKFSQQIYIGPADKLEQWAGTN